MSLQAEYYSEKSIAVFGDTKPFSSEMKSLGGTFNYNLRGRPGWIFQKSKEPELMQFIANVNAGLYRPSETPQVVQLSIPQPTMSQPGLTFQQAGAPMAQPTISIPQPAMSPSAAMARLTTQQPLALPPQRTYGIPGIPQQPLALPPQQSTGSFVKGINVKTMTSNVSYPNVFTAADGQSYQIIMYTVPLPTVGQTVDVVIDGNTTSYRVDQVSNHPVDTMTLTKLDDSTAAIANLVSGKWQIPSMIQRHELVFRNESEPKVGMSTIQPLQQ